MDLEPVASAPRSGEFVVLHDLNGRCETGRWSTPDDDWIQADGSPIRINPTHWQLLLDQTTLDVGFAEYRTQTKSLFRGQWALACAGVAVVLGLSVLTLPSLGSRFNTAADKSKVQLAAAAEPNTTRGIRDAGLASVIAASLRSPDPARPEQEIAQTAKPEPMREGPAPASPQSKDLQVAQAAATQDQGEAADRERERAAAFARDLAAVLEDIETLKAEAATAAAEHLKTQRALQAAQAALTEQRAATERERERNDALARDFSAVVVAELKISEEKAAALDLERQTVASLTRDLAATRQEAEGLKAGIAALETQHRPSPAQRAETVGTANRGERAANAAPEVQRGQPAPALAPPSANEEKVLARADGLIRQGDIKGARLVLERALDTGSAHAAYALAETYDPRMLASWQTYGVRGDPERARQLYAQAYAAGMHQARERAETLK